MRLNCAGFKQIENLTLKSLFHAKGALVAWYGSWQKSGEFRQRMNGCLGVFNNILAGH